MDLLLLAERENTLLGREFLTWLWYKSEAQDGVFKSPDGVAFGLRMEKSVAVRGGEGDNAAAAMVSGPGGELAEARTGLRHGKTVDKAVLRLSLDSNDWELKLSSQDFGVGGMKTPKVETESGDGVDPDALFLEKVFLIEKGLSLVDQVFARFLQLRLSPDWPGEVRGFRAWIKAE